MWFPEATSCQKALALVNNQLGQQRGVVEKGREWPVEKLEWWSTPNGGSPHLTGEGGGGPVDSKPQTSQDGEVTTTVSQLFLPHGSATRRPGKITKTTPVGHVHHANRDARRRGGDGCGGCSGGRRFLNVNGRRARKNRRPLSTSIDGGPRRSTVDQDQTRNCRAPETWVLSRALMVSSSLVDGSSLWPVLTRGCRLLEEERRSSDSKCDAREEERSGVVEMQSSLESSL
ncbi:hypothetical protein BJ875DRAFT_440528 [Amylocarpus encephaloides]|uniref:Uncharacterized protein n=1 Tax=Amylocarpus encephaloides TaxID=45428 RepID=A0A9P7YK94_9HELO|nr:hypothetical protein BJ875DRAFT_440528 [Amylocarpus encephaloides]